MTKFIDSNLQGQNDNIIWVMKAHRIYHLMEHYWFDFKYSKIKIENFLYYTQYDEGYYEINTH